MSPDSGAHRGAGRGARPALAAPAPGRARGGTGVARRGRVRGRVGCGPGPRRGRRGPGGPAVAARAPGPRGRPRARPARRPGRPDVDRRRPSRCYPRPCRRVTNPLPAQVGGGSRRYPSSRTGPGVAASSQGRLERGVGVVAGAGVAAGRVGDRVRPGDGVVLVTVEEGGGAGVQVHSGSGHGWVFRSREGPTGGPEAEVTRTGDP